MPIYYVISEYVRSGAYAGAPIKQILISYACEMDDIDQLWKDACERFHLMQRSCTTDIYYREPANPLKERATTDVSRETSPEESWN